MSGGDTVSGERRSVTTYGEPLLSLPTNSFRVFTTFTEEHKALFYKYLHMKLKSAIEKDRKSIEFFRLGNTPYIFRLERNFYEDSITQMKDFYVAEEDYRMANRCMQLLDRHRVNVNLQKN